MAQSKKSTPSKSSPARPAAKKPAAPVTVSRNSPVPRPSPAVAKREITHEMIAKRAFEIYASGKGGSAMDNWLRAEKELRGY